ncbi:MAG: PIG-L deacetylase family protein [Candidatus Ornithospirochaeta sp.]
MNYLVVIAHSGDEILGCGGTIQKLQETGSGVSVCVLDGKDNRIDSRNGSIEDHRLSFERMGIREVWALETKKNNVPFSSMVSFVEKCIKDSGAQGIITYHPAIGDRERREAGRAAQKASQLYKRDKSVPPLSSILYMEFPSITDISLDPTISWFSPNFYVSLDQKHLDEKIKALSFFNLEEVVTSLKTVEAVAAVRGAQSGSVYSEAFESVYIKV